MSFTLLLILALVVALLYVGLKALRLHYEQKEHEVQLKVMQRSGALHAHQSLNGQLSRVIRIHHLLEQEGSVLSEKWQKAFSALYSEEAVHFRNGEQLSKQLDALGFTTHQVGWLIRWTAQYPEHMVILLLALLSGLPEEQAWGVALDV